MQSTRLEFISASKYIVLEAGPFVYYPTRSNYALRPFKRLVITLNLIEFYFRIGLGMVRNFIIRRVQIEYEKSLSPLSSNTIALEVDSTHNRNIA